MFKLVFFVPEQYAESVKSAVFATGAGRYGEYDTCAWQTLGTGQFRPLDGSTPFLGHHGHIERVPELRIEILCADEVVESAIRALLDAHPYEEPAYEVYRAWHLEEIEKRRAVGDSDL
jgi:hypothetical protein